jgi:hypothetical protein
MRRTAIGVAVAMVISTPAAAQDEIRDRATCSRGLSGTAPACIVPADVGRTFRVGQHLMPSDPAEGAIDQVPKEAQAKVPTHFRAARFGYIYQPDRIYVVRRNDRTVKAIINLDIQPPEKG